LQVVAEKTAFAVDSGLSVMSCVGEKKEHREADKTFEIVDAQLAAIAGSSLCCGVASTLRFATTYFLLPPSRRRWNLHACSWTQALQPVDLV
jgi:hypothetical protein